MSYPLQYFQLAIRNTDSNIIASGNSLSPSYMTGSINENGILISFKQMYFC